LEKSCLFATVIDRGDRLLTATEIEHFVAAPFPSGVAAASPRVQAVSARVLRIQELRLVGFVTRETKWQGNHPLFYLLFLLRHVPPVHFGTNVPAQLGHAVFRSHSRFVHRLFPEARLLL